MKSRIMITCSRCNKNKQHFGNGMCSACLRRTKRETKPSFYLGTCYSELTRRCKKFDPLRPNYYGKQKLSRQQFIDLFINNNQFLKLYKTWQNNNFKRNFAPSIDRIDNKKDYTADNLRFISQVENSCKDKRMSVIINNIEFISQKDASIYLKVSTATVSRKLKHKNSAYIKGIKVCRY